MVDRIYRTRENRGFRKEHGITMCGRGPGRPARQDRESRRSEARDEADRIEVERFFGREKRTCGAALLLRPPPPPLLLRQPQPRPPRKPLR